MAKPLDRPCPVCGNRDSAPFLRKNDLQLVQCPACSMIYANPVSPALASGEFYDQAGGEYLSADKLQGDYSNVRFERELRLFRSHCPRGSVLDVGCSSGGFLHQLSRRHPQDYKILGTDVSKAPLDHAAKMGVPVLNADFPTHSFNEQFDAITFWAVMEHLVEPGTFLKKAASLLKPGGLCFVLVPNMKSLAVRLLGAKYRYILPEHVNYFTSATLRQFTASELTVLELHSTHFNPLVIWRDLRHGAREIPREERARLLKRTNAYKQSPLMLPVKLLYRATELLLGKFSLADNLLIIARKS
ncbi:MAG: Methyltransferase type 11 [Pedosphaera sp.]|nr:Methyltransferase type 11 [Pedosphaera sp.]